MDTLHQLRWSDVWLLVSLYYCSLNNEVRLRDAIAGADAINHAVMNFEELSSALVRLEAHDLIKVGTDPWRATCTQKGRETVDPVATQNSSPFRVWHGVENLLGVQPWKPGEPLPHPENSLPYPGFTRENYEKEVAAYLKTMGGKS
jgi:hypothetical protein